MTGSKLGDAIIAIAITLLLAACGMAPNGGMTASPAARPFVAVSASSPAFKAVSIGAISSSGDATRLWVSDVSIADFRAALQQSLQRLAVAADGTGQYRLNAELLELGPPKPDPDAIVIARIHYTLVGPDPTQPPLLDQVVETPFTAKQGDSAQPLRLVTERVVRENIGVIVHQVVEAVQGPGQPAWGPSRHPASAGSGGGV